MVILYIVQELLLLNDLLVVYRVNKQGNHVDSLELSSEVASASAANRPLLLEEVI